MTPPRMLDCRAVRALVGASKSTIYSLIKRDGFPKPIRLGSRAVRWYEAEIVAWLDARPRGGSDRPAA